jgi:hypothetical protein
LKELLTAGPHLSVSGAKRKGRRGRAGPAGCEVGPLGPTARAGKRNRPTAWGCLRAKKDVGPAGKEKEREREREKDFLFLLNFFQIHFSNIQTSIKQKSMHSNHDAQTLIISKLF